MHGAAGEKGENDKSPIIQNSIPRSQSDARLGRLKLDCAALLFWMMGDLSFLSFSPPAPCMLLRSVGLAIAGARTLNVLARGENRIPILRSGTVAARIALFCATAALTATAVITGRRHRLHWPRYAASGAAGSREAITRIVVPASTPAGRHPPDLGRHFGANAASPRQLPVGALTALIGVPLFLILMAGNGA